MKLICYLIISAVLLTVPVNMWGDDGISAITMPSADVALAFVQPGRIAKVYLKEGDLVKPEQIIIQQDDAAEQAQLSLYKEQSEDTIQIQSQEASLEQKRVYLERLKWASERGSATEQEREDAKLAVKIAEFSLQAAKFDHEQNKRKYTEAKIRVDNMRLKSPIAGRVEKIDVKKGESIEAHAKAVRVVRIDPLWIDVHVPLEKKGILKSGKTAKVTFAGDEQNTANGKIISISTVADAASSTLRARIEVSNKSKRPAGELVTVTFTNP